MQVQIDSLACSGVQAHVLCSAVKPGECFTQHSVHASCYDYEIKAALELHPVSWGENAGIRIQ